MKLAFLIDIRTRRNSGAFWTYEYIGKIEFFVEFDFVHVAFNYSIGKKKRLYTFNTLYFGYCDSFAIYKFSKNLDTQAFLWLAVVV